MNIEVEEDNLVRRLLPQLELHLGRKMKARAPTGGLDEGIDLLVVPRVGRGPRLAIQAKAGRPIARAQARHLAATLHPAAKRHGAAPMIFATGVPEAAAAVLRDARVMYVDAAGNAFIVFDRPRIHVDVRGRRQQEIPPAPGRLIEPAGLRVLCAILAEERAAAWPVRQLARVANVATGTVANTLVELERGGYLVRHGRRDRRVEDRRALLELFVTGYELKLRPACRPVRLRHRERDPLALTERLGRLMNPGEPGWALTGAAAAYQIIHYLQPDVVTVFVDRVKRTALDKEPVLPDPEGGNLILLDHFAPVIADPEAPHRARRFLIYAELLADGRAREAETAALLLPQVDDAG